uniref:Odorant receptor n=1 Tax=Eucryptorrhynchus brandti TaxID=436910 RepID=A0A8F4RRC8_EUCBR|nr:odorant receptor 44 [Eucryptorrhynchus brandti]
MYSADTYKLINPVKIYLICAGKYRIPPANKKLSMLYKVYSIFIQLSFITFCLSVWPEFLRLVIQRYDTEILISSFVIVINCIKILIKLLIFQKNKVLDFFYDVIKKEEDLWECFDEPDIKSFYIRKFSEYKKFILVQALLTLLAGFVFQITGLVNNLHIIAYNQAHNTTLELRYGYQLWLPFNKLDHMFVFYLLQIQFTWAASILYCMMNLIVSALLIIEAMQLEIFQIRVRNFIPPNESNWIMEPKVLELKKLIKEHQDLIRVGEHLNKCIKNIVFMEYILGSSDIASAVVTLTKSEGVDNMGRQLILIILLSIQIFILAWNTNEVKIQSEGIADAVFQSNWFMLNKEGTQLTQVLIERAQKPLVITIGPFGAMTTESALTIIRAAYSYVSIMRQ